MTKMLAMVLAGGRGTRMDVLCHVRPKPAMSFAGGFRVVDFSLSNCIHSGIADIAILTDYRRSQMADYLNRWKSANAGSIQFDILEPREVCYKGTADALYQNLDYIQDSDAGLVLVLGGDHIYKMDYREMVAFHERTGADATVGVVAVPPEQTYRFGTVKLDAASRITEFVEKASCSLSNLASMGIYVFNKKVLMERLVEDAARPESSHDFGYAILPEMVRRDRVFAYQFRGYWQDIGSRDTYYAANMGLLGRQPTLSLDSQWNILTEEPALSTMKTVNRGCVQNSLVSPGCVIRGRVENSILSAGVCVEEGAVVRDSILMSGVSVGSHSVVERCILDENVSIGRYCHIGFDSGGLSAEPAITVVGKGAVVPAHTAVGRNCTIMPNAEPADFPSNTVLSGTTLSPHPAAVGASRSGS